MSCGNTHICHNPGLLEKEAIVKTFFGLSPTQATEGSWQPTVQEFFVSYTAETALLRFGKGDHWEDQWTFPIRAHWQVVDLIEYFRTNLTTVTCDNARLHVRSKLSLPQSTTFDTEDDAIYLTLRLWLMINFRLPDQVGMGQGRPCVVWRSDYTLALQLETIFEASSTVPLGHHQRLDPDFTAVTMMRVCRLKVEWTSSLEDHLRLDREHRTLWVFANKRYLSMRPLYISSASLFPDLLDETGRTLDLLFPSWNPGTKTLMKQMGLDFHRVNPQDRSLSLRHYSVWRDRILELYEDIYLAPAQGWAQLWNDRRDPQKFWTFWVALLVLILTLLSTFASLLQTFVAFKTLGRL